MDLLPVVGFIDTNAEIELCLLRSGEEFLIGWAVIDADTLATAEVGFEAQRVPWKKLLELLMHAYAGSLDFRNINIPVLQPTLQLPYWLPKNASITNNLYWQTQQQLSQFLSPSERKRAFVAEVTSAASAVALGKNAIVSSEVDEWVLAGLDGGSALFTEEELLQLFLRLLVDEQAENYFSPLCGGRVGDQLGSLIQGLLELWSAESGSLPRPMVASPTSGAELETASEVVTNFQAPDLTMADLAAVPVEASVPEIPTQAAPGVSEKLPVEVVRQFIEHCSTPAGEDLMAHFDLVAAEIIETFTREVQAEAA